MKHKSKPTPARARRTKAQIVRSVYRALFRASDALDIARKLNRDPTLDRDISSTGIEIRFIARKISGQYTKPTKQKGSKP